MIARINCATEFDSLINKISRAYGNNPALVKAIISAESSFNPSAHNTRGEDSRGLGQINADTARALGVHDLTTLFEPETNVMVMNKLLVDLKNRYSHILDIISAYNAGRPLLKDGFYVNSNYVLKVYSRYLAYSVLMI